MLKIALVSILLYSFISVASNLCSLVYQGYKSDSNIAQISQALNASPIEIQRAIDIFSEKSIAEVRSDVHAALKLRQDFIQDHAFDKKIFVSYFKQLKKSGFLLGPLHEFAYSASIQLYPGINNSHMDFADYYSQKKVTKKYEFDKFKLDGKPNPLAEKKVREERAKRMLGEINSYYLGDLSNWLNYSNEKKLMLVENWDSHSKYRGTHAEAVKHLDALAEIYVQPGGRMYIEKILEYTLPDVHSVVKARARGTTGKVISIATPVTLSLLPALGASVGLDASMPWTFLIGGAGLLFGGTGLPLISSIQKIGEVPGKVTGFGAKVWKRVNLKGKASRRLEKEEQATTHEQREMENKKTKVEILNQMDIDFNILRREFAALPMTAMIQYNQWGRGFTQVTINLTERLTILSDWTKQVVRLNRAVEKRLSEAKEGQIGWSVGSNELVTRDREVTEVLAYLSQLKADILAVSYGIDRLKTEIPKIKASGIFTEGDKPFVESKDLEIAQIENNLMPTAALILKLERLLLNESDRINGYQSEIVSMQLDHHLSK